MKENNLNLKAGLEIHQQLNTRKLFCECPSILRNDKPDVIIHRRLHAVAGETGEIDIAAKHEMEQDKKFIYEGYSDTNCLLEYDECPPSRNKPRGTSNSHPHLLTSKLRNLTNNSNNEKNSCRRFKHIRISKNNLNRKKWIHENKTRKSRNQLCLLRRRCSKNS